MKRQVGLIQKCVLSVMLSSAPWAISGMQARAADQLPIKAPAAVEAIPYWWWHGEVDIGGRFFLNNPQRNGVNYLGQNSLAKFYEYRDLRPGPFGNIWLSTGSRDGLYQVDLGGKNIGWEDQYYYLDASKAGQHYFNFQWDQTPHLYSNSALTPYSVVGGNVILPPGLATSLGTQANALNFNGAGGVRSIVNANVHQTDIGIRRDTAAFEYRWTPTDAWDIKADYSHMHRDGTQAMGVVFNNTSSGIIAQAPTPVNDTTQNFGVNGEYAGTSPWGKKFNFKLAYNGSVYDGDSSFNIDDPFFLPNTRGNPSLTVAPLGFAPCNATDCNPAFGTVSMYPSNNANAFSGTAGVDLPGNSRYMGTVSYTMMRQNDAYLPFTSNPTLSQTINGKPVTSLAALPFASLNGEINTLLSNNVIVTQITPELKSKLSYRYYNYDNGSPTQFFPLWVGTDEHVYTGSCTPTTQSGSCRPRISVPTSYTKQNALAELIWTPLNGTTLGAQYGYERYNYAYNDVDHTGENLVKLYGVYKAYSWLVFRGSWQFSERRYGTYTNQIQSSFNGTWNQNYRSPYLANLNQNKGKFQFDVVVIPTVTVSPFAGFRLNDYQTNINAGEVGVLSNDSWNAGVELVWAPNHRTQFMFSYTYEDGKQNIIGGAGTTGLVTAGSGWNSNLDDNVNTFTAAVKTNLIEDKLDLKLSYVYSLANGSWTTAPLFYNGYTVCPAPAPFTPACPIYPDTRTTWQRLEALATYKLDPGWVHQMGWKGEAQIKVRYAWERNSVNDWQINNMQPYMYFPPATGPATANNTQTQLWLAGDNPNYNVHLMAAALVLKW